MYLCLYVQSMNIKYLDKLQGRVPPDQNKKKVHINRCLQTLSFRGYSCKNVPLAVRAMFKRDGAPASFSWPVQDRLLPFPETQIPHQRSSFWNCGQHPKGRDRAADGTSTRRLPTLLPEVGTTSAAVCGFPRELLWSGLCWFVVGLLMKKNYSTSLITF